MDINLAHIWSQMPWPVKAVVIVLTMQAIASLAVLIDRIYCLKVSERKSKKYAGDIEDALESGDLDKAMDLSSNADGSHLALYLYTGLSTFMGQIKKGIHAEKAATMTRRALERKGETVSANLNQGMNILASTGSTAPFVGLLGTVLGILNAFKQIAASGSGGIATIGGSIGEALIVTGYGLVVAIPTVLVFNWLSNRISLFEGALNNAGNELIDRLEFSESIES